MSIFRRMFNRKDNTNEGITSRTTTTIVTNSNTNVATTSSASLNGGTKNVSGKSSGGGMISLSSTMSSSTTFDNDGHHNGNNSNYRQEIKHETELSGNLRVGNFVPISPKKTVRQNDKRNSAVLQLTPLWEHIINTRSLPDNIEPQLMFDEFLERLRDPEWQVRQHALRVLIDVLQVIGNKADIYFHALLPQLIENLGHSAPTVRKGALDCLRVYLAETAMPETVMLQICDIGLQQRVTLEPFGGRLACGVMLSLPSLVQATMSSTKSNFILKTTIDLLVSKMSQITYQEITLKVLLKFKELLGEQEFLQYISPGDYKEFDLLCNVYGIKSSNHINYQSNGGDFKKSWQIIPSFDSNDTSSFTTTDMIWQSSDDEDLKFTDMQPTETTRSSYSFTPVPPSEMLKKNEPKVIMETEIKINNDTVTMRILEAKDDSFISDSSYRDGSSDISTIPSRPKENSVSKEDTNSVKENTGLIHVLTDSELDEINRVPPDPNVLSTPKRVTFGGEIVKMRTPDSDGTTATSDIDTIDLSQMKNENSYNATQNMVQKSQSMQHSAGSKPGSAFASNRQERIKSAFLVDAASDQMATSSTESPPKSFQNDAGSQSNSNTSDKASEPQSPRSPFRRNTISPVLSPKLLSPRVPHKEIEVLHNLQREVSPNQVKDIKPKIIDVTPKEIATNSESSSAVESANTKTKIESWEDLKLVDNQTLQNLRSGDWQRRSHAITVLEDALRSPENLVLVQPHLESLLRTLLSSERNLSVNEDKKRVIMNLISRLPLDNLERRTVQILTGLCRQGGASSNRVAKLLMQRLSPSAVVLKLLSNEFLYTRSSKFREHALQIVMYALMTFPSTSFDTSTCVIGATYAALDSKKRVRQAALDILAILGQVASPRTVIEIVKSVTEVRSSSSDTAAARLDNRSTTADFIAAVKARLSRKQLPNITADDSVVYALRMPSPNYGNDNSQKLAADIRWIASGIGSVSPTSIKKRSQKFSTAQSYQTETQTPNFKNQNDIEIKKKIFGNSGPHEVQNYGIGNDHMKHEERGGNRYKEITSIGSKYYADYKDEFIGTHNNKRKVFAQSFSDSSQDDRSSDGAYFAYENGFKTSHLSRFPSMEKPDRMHEMSKDDHFFYKQPYDVANHFSFQRKTSKFVPRKFNKIHSQPSVYSVMGENSQDSSTYASSSEKRSYVPRRFASFEKLNFNNKPLQQPYIISNNVHKNSAVHNPPMHSEPSHLKETKIFTAVQKSPVHSIQSSKTNSNTATPTQANAKKSPAISTISHDVPITTASDQIEIINFDTEEYTESSELSSDDRINSSGHSTPTRVLVDRMTPSSSKTSPSKRSDVFQPKPVSNTNSARSRTVLSRPRSSYSNNSLKSFVLEEELSKIDLTDAINMSDTDDATIDEPDGIIETIDVVANTADEMDSRISPIKSDSKSEENSLDTKSIGTESRTETEQFSIETVIMINAKDEDGKSATQIEIEKEIIDVKVLQSEPEEKDMDEITLATTDVESTITIQTDMPSVSPNKKNLNYTRAEIEEKIEKWKLKETEIDLRSSTSTETSSDYQQSSTSVDFLLNQDQSFSPVKTVIQKSKSTIFNRKNRRVSPVKLSIKHAKMELYPQTLSKFEKPKEAIYHTFQQLDSSSWEIVMDGLVDIVRLIRHHPESLEPHCHVVCAHLAKTVKNLRSQVSRAACQASAEYFAVRSKFIEQECDDLVGNLLHRTADTNRFLRADAERALESMCDNLSFSKVLNILTLRGVSHQNAIVRTATAKLMNRLIERVGYDKVYHMPREQREKVFVTACTFLMEGSLETRSYAKTLLRSLSDHPMYNRSILDFIPPRIYRNIEKSLKSIKS